MSPSSLVVSCFGARLNGFRSQRDCDRDRKYLVDGVVVVVIVETMGVGDSRDLSSPLPSSTAFSTSIGSEPLVSSMTAAFSPLRLGDVLRHRTGFMCSGHLE